MPAELPVVIHSRRSPLRKMMPDYSRSDHTRPYQIRLEQINPDQTKSARPNQTRSDQIRPDQTRADQTTPDQTGSAPTRADQNRSVLTRPDQIRPDQPRSDQIRRDQTIAKTIPICERTLSTKTLARFCPFRPGRRRRSWPIGPPLCPCPMAPSTQIAQTPWPKVTGAAGAR